MGTIKPSDIPDDKLDAVIERLTKEKEVRISAKVETGEAVRIPVSIVGDQDVEFWKEHALQDANVPPGTAVHFDIHYYEYPPMEDGSRNPMNTPSRLREASPSDPDLAPSTQSRRYDDENRRRPQIWEPQGLIVGEPRPVWTEMRRPGPHHHGEIAEGFYIVVDGRVHLADSLGKAIGGYSDIAGIDPMARARKLLRSKAMREQPDRFWTDPARVQPTGGY